MTGTCVLNNLEHETFAAIRRAIQESNSTALTYESYDRTIQRGIFTFREPSMIPDELIPYRIRLAIPSRPDFKDIDFPPLGDIASEETEEE